MRRISLSFVFSLVILAFIFLSLDKTSYAASCPSVSTDSSCAVCANGHFSPNNSGSCVDSSGNYLSSTSCSIISCQSGYHCAGISENSTSATGNGCCDSSGKNCYTTASGPNPTSTPAPPKPASSTNPPAPSTSQNAGQACLPCPDIAGTSGHGLLKTNLDQYNTLNCPPVNQASSVCLYSGPNGYSICNAAIPQSCNNSQKCDAIAGCIDKNSSPPSSCAKSGNVCYSDSDCTTSTGNSCTGYHCMQGGYIIAPNNPLQGKCQYAPNARYSPGVSSGVECDPSKQTACDSGQICLPDTSLQKFTCQSPDNQSQFNQVICGITGSSCQTALGNINTKPFNFITWAFSLILSISGGIALILIIISGYRVLASQGNPEALKGAREQLTAAIVGLLFVIFALVILQIIGYDILRIPGFGASITQPPNAHIGGQ